MGAALSVETVLVPVDGSDESTEAVGYAAAIAEEYDALVHAIYVFDETAARAIESGDADHDRLVEESRSYFETVDEVGAERDVSLTHSMAYGFSTRRLTVHPGSVVLDAAEQMAADFIVVPRERREEPTVLEKAAEYVLLYASQPVLSV